jgi:exonuclease SbcD
MIKLLHFSDAHIDMANYGRHDATTGLPVRVLDFLKSLDTIVDAAIAEQVDLVLFAGDAYKDRSPAPTFQREWGKRIMRLAKAGIQTLLLVGNHDLSPALGRAHALEAFDTLDVPHVRVLDQPQFLRPADLGGIPAQILAIPWISRSGLMAYLDLHGDAGQVYDMLAERLKALVDGWLETADPGLPVVLTAHCSVQGAVYGGERTVMLGGDLVLPASLVKDRRLDYVALGHIHKAQDLNDQAHPPVIYPGSIERVDFGEARDDKYFVIAQIAPGQAKVEWRCLEGIRPFVDRFVRLESDQFVTETLHRALPAQRALEGAIARLVVEYPRAWESLIDEAALRRYTANCLEFHLVKRPIIEARLRIPGDQAIGSLSPLELLELYWGASNTPLVDREILNRLAAEIIQETRE